jgi:cell division protease FtsH
VDRTGGEAPYSEETARMVDAEVARIIRECHEEALRLLSVHRPQLDMLAEALLDRETLDERDVLKVTGLPPAPALESGKAPRTVRPSAA